MLGVIRGERRILFVISVCMNLGLCLCCANDGTMAVGGFVGYGTRQSSSPLISRNRGIRRFGLCCRRRRLR